MVAAKRSTREVLRDALNNAKTPSADLIALANENGFVWSGTAFVDAQDLEAPTSSACRKQPWCNRQVGHDGGCSASFLPDGTVIG